MTYTAPKVNSEVIREIKFTAISTTSGGREFRPITVSVKIVPED